MNMKRLAMTLSGIGITSAILLTTAGGASATQRKVTWQNVATNRWLAMDTGMWGTGTTVNASSRNVGGWYESQYSDGSFKLRWAGYSSGDKCLDSNKRGSVYAIACNGGNYQKWYETKTASGWRLKNKATGRILDSNKSSVYTLPDCGNKHQRWR